MRYQSLRPRLDPLLPTVEKPGRYIGLERNVTRKDLSKAAATLALAFPDTYEIGMSHTGLKILYELVNRRADFACERVYAPWVDLEAKMREAGIPLFSTESFAPVADFDVLGFSLQAELNYSNILNMLDLAGLPVWQRDRRETDPIVLGGGPCTANCEPIADFFDAFLIGDAEEALNVFLDAYRDGRSRGLSRRELLVHLAQLDGIYVPSLYDVAYDANGRIAAIAPNDPRAPKQARRTWVPVLKPEYYPDKPMVPSVEIVQDRLGLEVMRGCTQGCRFCQAGYWYRPVRELDPGDVAEMTKKFIADSGWSEVGLLSLSTADYSQIEPLVKCLAPQLSDRRVSISLPSLRAEAFSVGLADAVSEVRKSGFTFAPETGSDRLRRVINKTFTNDDMIQAADVAFARGWDLIKVYTMIGLPTETSADLDELVTLVAGILAQGRKHGRKNVNVAVGSFVPKSWTPFQWAPFDGVEALERKLVLSQGEVPQPARREDEVARAARGRDRVRALPRGPPRGAHPPHGLEVGRALRRLDRALPLRPLDEGFRGRGHPQGDVPARVRSRRDPALGRPRRLHQEALAPDRAHQGEEGDAHRGLQVGALLRLRRAGQRRGHHARQAACPARCPRSTPRRRRRATRPPTATWPRAPRTARRRCPICPRRRGARRRVTACFAIG